MTVSPLACSTICQQFLFSLGRRKYLSNIIFWQQCTKWKPSLHFHSWRWKITSQLKNVSLMPMSLWQINHQCTKMSCDFQQPILLTIFIIFWFGSKCCSNEILWPDIRIGQCFWTCWEYENIGSNFICFLKPLHWQVVKADKQRSCLFFQSQVN